MQFLVLVLVRERFGETVAKYLLVKFSEGGRCDATVILITKFQSIMTRGAPG